MEPNQPMQPVQPVPPMPAGAAPVPPTPVGPVAPVSPAAPKMEEAPVEVKPVMESKPVSETPKKKSNVPIIMMVLFLVIAAAGVGFGVWMMFEKDSMAENYTKQIAALKAQVATLQSENNNEEIDVEVNTDTPTETVNTEDYIYIGEWGIKIKLPEELKTVSYAFEYGADYTRVIATGVEGGGQYFPDFADLTKNTYGLANVYRHDKNWEPSYASPPTLVFSDDNYSYYSYHSQALYSAGIENVNADEREWESRTAQLFWDTFTNANNYSKI